MSGGLMCVIKYVNELPIKTREFFEEFPEQNEFFMWQLNDENLLMCDIDSLNEQIYEFFHFKRFVRCYYCGYTEFCIPRDLSNYKPYNDYVLHGIKPPEFVDYTLNCDNTFYNTDNTEKIQNNFYQFLTNENLQLFFRQTMNSHKRYCIMRDLIKDFGKYCESNKNGSFVNKLKTYLQTQTRFTADELHKIFLHYPCYCCFCEQYQTKSALMAMHDELNGNWTNNNQLLELIFVDNYLMSVITKYVV